MPPDIMHDLLSSGVVEKTLELTINRQIDLGYFTQESIKARLNGIKFQSSDKTSNSRRYHP